MMLLTWNTLEEAADYIKLDNPKIVLQLCLDRGVPVHVQIQTDREDILQSADPDFKWIGKNECVELPFNIDLQTFLGGNGLITIVRRNGILYKFDKPGIKAELADLRLSKNALIELRNVIQPQPQQKYTQKTQQQEEAILDALKRNKFHPLSLQRSESGKSGIKKQIKLECLRNTSLFTNNSFDKAWQRLLDENEIKYKDK